MSRCNQSLSSCELQVSSVTPSICDISIVAVIVAPVVGFLSDWTMCMYKNASDKHRDVQQTLVSYNAVTLTCIMLGFSYVIGNTWIVLVLISATNGLTYTFETIGISICFPGSSQGIIFALVELVGSLLNFVQIPITTAVKQNKSFDSVTIFVMVASLSTLICAPVLYSIGKKVFKFTKN